MEFTANQIAALAGGTVEGNGDVKLTTVAKIEEGHPGALSISCQPQVYTLYLHHRIIGCAGQQRLQAGA